VSVYSCCYKVWISILCDCCLMAKTSISAIFMNKKQDYEQQNMSEKWWNRDRGRVFWKPQEKYGDDG